MRSRPRACTAGGPDAVPGARLIELLLSASTSGDGSLNADQPGKRMVLPKSIDRGIWAYEPKQQSTERDFMGRDVLSLDDLGALRHLLEESQEEPLLQPHLNA